MSMSTIRLNSFKDIALNYSIPAGAPVTQFTSYHLRDFSLNLIKALNDAQVFSTVEKLNFGHL